MRIRRKTWTTKELDNSKIYISDPISYKNQWGDCYKNNNGKFHIELGCGKGRFISELASSNLDINYLSLDIKDVMLGYASRNICMEYERINKEINNILITAYDIERINEVLGEKDLVDRIYINFCNPWPKARHRKKRLTHTLQLEKYKKFLKDDGQIYFKTDDQDLYFCTLIYLEEAGFKIIDKSEDIYKKSIFENIQTEHEEMFLNDGVKIKAIIAKKV